MATLPDAPGRPPGQTAFVFIVGTGRSGSTLLQELIARHPDVGFVSNLEDRLPLRRVRGRFNNTIYRRVPVPLTEKGRIRYAPTEAYRVLEREVSPIISVPFRDLTEDDVTPWLEERFRRFFEERAALQGKPVFLHKFTGWPRARFIHRVLPTARFINIVRDGRAVANSFLQVRWWRGYRGPSEWGWGPLPEGYAREWEESGRSFVLLAGIEWKLLIDAYEAARSAIPGGLWMDLRYEDFLEDPRAHLEKMLSFMGLSWAEEFDAALARYSFRRGRSEAYRSELTAAQLDVLNRSLAGHLSKLGYGGVPTPEQSPGPGLGDA